MLLPDLDDDACAILFSHLSLRDRAKTAETCHRLCQAMHYFDATRPWRLLRGNPDHEYTERGYGPVREELVAHEFTGFGGCGNLLRQHLWLLVLRVEEDEATGQLCEHDEIRVYDMSSEATLVASVVLASEASSVAAAAARALAGSGYDSDSSWSPTRSGALRGLLRPAQPVDGVFSCVVSTPSGYWAVQFGMARIGCTVPETAEQRKLAIDEKDIVDQHDQSEAVLEVLPFRSAKEQSEHGWLVRRTGKYSSLYPHLFFRKDTTSEFSHCMLHGGLRQHRFDPFGADGGVDYHFDGVETDYFSVGGYLLAHPVGDGRLGAISARRNGYSAVGNRRRNPQTPRCILLEDSQGASWCIVADAAGARAHLRVGWIDHLEAWEPKTLGKASAKPAFVLKAGELSLAVNSSQATLTELPASPDTPMHLVLASPRLAVISKDGVPLVLVRVHERAFLMTYLDMSPLVPSPLNRLSITQEFGMLTRRTMNIACFQRDGLVHFWAIWPHGALLWKLDSPTAGSEPLPPPPAVHPVICHLTYDERDLFTAYPRHKDSREAVIMSLTEDKITLSLVNDYGEGEFCGLIEMK